jgi:rhomboid protease GluP
MSVSLGSELDETWVEVGCFRAPGEAEQYALVLVASGVASRMVSGAAGTALFVTAPDATRALGEISAYRQETRPRPSSGPALRPIRDGLNAALAYCVLLVLIHAAASRGASSIDWLDVGNAQAGLIRGGEWWRAVTALSLHADIEHLLSNLVLGGILGLLLAQLLGSGLAWLAILTGGAVANLAVAFVLPVDHSAIGASTAVFAALGLLASLAWGRQQLLWQGLRRWRPIAAALMLLALLGVGGEDGAHIDVWGHVAGLLTGLAGGVGLIVAEARLPKGRRAQIVYGADTLGLYAASWIAALSR